MMFGGPAIIGVDFINLANVKLQLLLAKLNSDDQYFDTVSW